VKLRDVTIARTKIMPCGNLGSVSKTCTGVCKCCRKTTRLVSTNDAAQYLGVSSRQLRRYVYDGKITAINTLTKSWQFDTLDLDSLILKAKEEAHARRRMYISAR
jgi:hypothetical protein